MVQYLVDVLIPTYKRPAALAVTLTSLAAQSFRSFRIFISDQTEDECAFNVPEVNAALNVLYTHGHPIALFRHIPRRGMAEQRQFLLDQSLAPYVLYLDDDLILENYVLQNLVYTIQTEECGFVGSPVIGLSYIHDIRPKEHHIELWEGRVQPEHIRPDMPQWERYRLHNAANPFHVAQKLQAKSDRPIRYRVAWIGGCVLYDAAKLRSIGGFTFWNELPDHHAGEDVVAELRVMDRYGGCGLLPSGVYHQELPTTLPDRQVDAPKYLTV